MSDSLAITPSRPGAPPRLEATALLRAQAAIQGPPAPAPSDPNMVLRTAADGGVVVYPPSEKLVILAAERKRLRGGRRL